MQDREPTYPGRVTLTPVYGLANTYDMERADRPLQEGTPLNKANLLSDATAAAIKALLASQTEDPATPNDALNILAQAVEDVATVAAGKCSIETSTYTGTGTVGSANPVTLTFPKKPTLIIVFRNDGEHGFLLMISNKTLPDTSALVHSITSYYATWVQISSSWQGSTLQFYYPGYVENRPEWQGNASGALYQVIAFYAQD